MSHSQFHCTGRAYLDMHGLIFETSICYWQDQPGRPPVAARGGPTKAGRAPVAGVAGRREPRTRAPEEAVRGLTSRWRALDGRPRLPRRTRVEGMLPKGFLGPVASCSVRSPEHATRSEGLRKRVSGARPRRRRTVSAGSPEGRPTAAAT